MSTVEEYIARFPEDKAIRLRQLRALIIAALPEAAEEIKWSTPAYSTATVLVTFAGFSKHLNLYLTPSTIDAFEQSLTGYTTGKSAIRFPYDESLPEPLINDLLAHRLDEYTNDGVSWM